MADVLGAYFTFPDVWCRPLNRGVKLALKRESMTRTEAQVRRIMVAAFAVIQEGASACLSLSGLVTPRDRTDMLDTALRVLSPDRDEGRTTAETVPKPPP